MKNNFTGIKKPLLIILLFCCVSGFIAVDGSGLQKSYDLKWEGLKEVMFEDEKHRYLSFGESLFLDTLPGIPCFFDRFRIDAPHISYHITLSGIEVDTVSGAERDFLEDIGFAAVEFILTTQMSSARGERYLQMILVPLRYNSKTDQFEKLVSFTVNKKYIYDKTYRDEPVHSYAEESVLAAGSWYKLCVDETGIYKLNYSSLEELGIDPGNIRRRDFSLFGNGTGMLPEANDEFRYDDLVENTIYVSGDPDGYFTTTDHILFYGKSPHQWTFNEEDGIWEHEVHLYGDKNCYFLSTDRGEGKRIEQQSSVSDPATVTVTTFTDYAYHQDDQRNLIESGRIWYGEIFNVTLSREFNFSFDDLVAGGQGHLKTHVAARSPVESYFLINVADSQQQISIQQVDMTTSTGNYARAGIKSFEFSQISTSGIPVTLTYNRMVSGGMGWLRYIALNVERELRFRGPQLLFRATGLSEEVAEYRVSDAGADVEVWDVTGRFNIKRQEGNVQGGEFVFRVFGDQVMNFVAHDGSGYLSAELKGKISNQDLHGQETHDLVIVTHPKFIDQAEELAEFRRENNGLTVLVATTNRVYNEFSSGVPDISAIRNFMKMFYDRAENPADMPRYLLLFGNGTYDNKDILGYGGNLIPTFQTESSLAPRDSWMSDDFFGLLADGEGEGAAGALDIGIGRLPVRTVNDASAVVEKIKRYETRIEGWDYQGDNYGFAGVVSNYGDWRNRIALIADDRDLNIHFNAAEELYELIKENHGVYNIEKIYLDAYEKVVLAGGERYPDVNKAINDLFNKGALFINYVGHGGFNGLAHERVLTFDDVQTWTNYYNLPVFMTATCDFSAFDIPDPSRLSAGVRIFLKRDGGASALFTTTRLAWADANKTLNNNFVKNAFKPMSNGEYPGLGDIIRKAKVESGPLQNKVKNFVLLGDPSMKLAYPEYDVETTFVPDTVKALEHVSVKGRMLTRQGDPVEDYNGIVYPTVYDKRRTFTTLGNSRGSIPAEFQMRTNILYRGKATVKNGKFEFEFIVPRDIGYNFGEGKISYYVDDGYTDGHGYYDQFMVGGTYDNYEPDNEGPQISLYLNDTTFVSGDEVCPDPLLLAYIYDKSGINTTGQLGHDIVAFLNDNMANPFILNDYYEADLDTYKSGRVIYPFANLEEGRYTLSMRVWDVHNNPSTESIEFIVAESQQFALQNLLNYPNPFSYNTTFKFSYSDTDAYEMDIRVEIYNILGQKVTTIKRTMNITGFDAFRIDWDGVGDDGRMLETGLYIYKVVVTTQNGEIASESSKFVIMR